MISLVLRTARELASAALTLSASADSRRSRVLRAAVACSESVSVLVGGKRTLGEAVLARPSFGVATPRADSVSVRASMVAYGALPTLWVS